MRKFANKHDSDGHPPRITPEELVGEEWAEWYQLTPLERWKESG